MTAFPLTSPIPAGYNKKDTLQKRIFRGGLFLKRVTGFFLALASVLLLAPSAWAAPAPQEDYIAANHTRSNGKPYYLMVNRAQSTVTVYGLDDGGYYTVPVKAMICSPGRKGHATPTGTFSIGTRKAWCHMIDGSYGQYATQIKGSILFHSVCYSKKDPSTLMTGEYNGLGAPASLGCVRLQTVDAKWIYDNCAQGTKVTVYDSQDPGPLGKPDKAVSYISPEQDNGWDPTDPREDNPWRPAASSSAAASDPVPAAPQPLPEGQAVSYSMMAQSIYQLSGRATLTQPAQMVTWAVNSRLLDGMIGPGFNPADPITRQDMVTMLYRYETGYCGHSVHNMGSVAKFTDGAGVTAYAWDAMRWAVGNGLINGTTATTLHPGSYASRTQLDALLQRYEALHT